MTPKHHDPLKHPPRPSRTTVTSYVFIFLIIFIIIFIIIIIIISTIDIIIIRP